jgi:hypothetical protein|tara:strand:+ start:995 stop:1132 length:138 start_codon:yes stop_codon:yes gene_type:complete
MPNLLLLDMDFLLVNLTPFESDPAETAGRVDLDDQGRHRAAIKKG